jgi:hypothetical protein
MTVLANRATGYLANSNDIKTVKSFLFLPPVLRIRIHESEIRIWFRLRIGILLSSCKNSKKSIDSYCFVTSFDFLSLKIDVNMPSKSNKQKNFF